MIRGLLTSEFWASLLGVLVALLHKKVGLDLDPTAVQSVALSIGAYALSRGVAKKQPAGGIVEQAPDLPAVAPK